MSIQFSVVQTNNKTIVMKQWSQKIYDCWKFIICLKQSFRKTSGLQKINTAIENRDK